MSHSASHRRRKATSNTYLSPPSPPPPPPPPPMSPSKQSRGFWDNFRMLRRKSSGGHYSDRSGSGGDTLLPTTFQISSPLGGRQHRKTIGGSGNNSSKPMSATNFCNGINNSFLMGGVDKRRYRRKRKSLAYRIFWSSLPRRLFVSFFLLYLAVYHLLVPIGEWIISEFLYNVKESYATMKTDKAILQGLVHGPKLDALASIQHERKYLKKLRSEREILEEHGMTNQNLQARWKVLERIVPEWFHRFDSDIVHLKPRTKYQEGKNDGAVQNEQDQEEETDDGGDDQSQKETKKEASHKAQKEKESEFDKKESTNAKERSKDAAAKSPEKKEKTESAKKIRVEENVNTIAKTKKRYHKPILGSSRHLTVQGGIYIPEDEYVSGDAEPNEEQIVLPLRTLHNMQDLGAAYSSCGGSSTSQSTTLVVQTSIDRLWILQETCSRWNTDPIIVVVFVPHSLDQESDSALLQTELETTSKSLLQNCPNLTLVRYEADHIESLQGRYPVNRLRNVGLDLVQTSHVLMMDVDFVPSKDLGRLVRDAIAKAHESSTTEDSLHKALVVPAFEKKPPKACKDSTDPAKCMSAYLKEDGAFLPRNFDELKECYHGEENECIVFQSENNLAGHLTTRSDRWMEQQWYEDEEKKKFRTIPCFHTARYEPYVVIEWCPLGDDTNKKDAAATQSSSPISPYYDERFYGYGKNKIELVSHLRRSNVRFEILPEGFLVHNPHPESSTKETWLNKKDETSDLHATMDALYSQFMAELDVKYKSVHNESTKLCERKTKPK